MTVQPSALTGATATPADDLALWSPFDLFRGEWAAPIALAHTWETEIGPGASGAEQRRALRGAPVRTITLPEAANASLDVAAMRAGQFRRAQARSLAPLVTEQTALTANVAIGATVIPCDTSDRLFFPGGRIAIFEAQPGRGRAARFEIAQIDAVAPTQLTLAAPTAQAFSAGDRVVPLMESEPVPDLRSDLLSSTIARQAAALRSSPARGLASILPATQTAGAAPSGAQLHDGIPIFDVWPDFRQVTAGVERADGSTGLGFGRTIAPAQDRAVRLHDLGFTFHTRAKARRLLRWFDYARGRAFPFWHVSPAGELRVVGGSIPGGVNLVVEPIRFDERFGPLPERPDHIAVVRRAGGARTVEIRRIVSTLLVPDSINPQLEQLTLDAPLSAVPEDELDRVSFAFLGRFADDELIERWITTEMMRTGVRIVETIREQSIEIGAPGACDDPPMGVIYDCAPPETTIGPPAGSYRLATPCAVCVKGTQPALYVKVGIVTAGTRYFVLQWRGQLYAYHAGATDPIFNETQIAQFDLWMTDTSEVAYEDISCVNVCNYIACRESFCPGGALVLFGDVSDSSKAECEMTTPACPDTTTVCFQTAPLRDDLGCPEVANSFCPGQDVNDPPACFTRECVYDCAAIPNITSCH